MNLSFLALICAFVIGPATAFADDEPAAVANSDRRVELMRKAETLLLHVDQAAAAFGWQAKTAASGKLLILCREGQGGVCIPLRLEEVRTVRRDDALFVEAAALSRALRFSINDRNGRVTLSPANSHDANEDADIPAYNATWGEGRGFRAGQTLPDIPLYDMQGREVRFSKFLGKQYIVYCWASW